jgi:hypothetical protein
VRLFRRSPKRCLKTIHSAAFQEIAETLQYGLRGLGHTAGILENIVDPQAINIILGAQLLTESDLKAIPPSIIYNLEQAIGFEPLSNSYLAKYHQIWDFSARNIQLWRAKTILILQFS